MKFKSILTFLAINLLISPLIIGIIFLIPVNEKVITVTAIVAKTEYIEDDAFNKVKAHEPVERNYIFLECKNGYNGRIDNKELMNKVKIGDEIQVQYYEDYNLKGFVINKGLITAKGM